MRLLLALGLLPIPCVFPLLKLFHGVLFSARVSRRPAPCSSSPPMAALNPMVELAQLPAPVTSAQRPDPWMLALLAAIPLDPACSSHGALPCFSLPLPSSSSPSPCSCSPWLPRPPSRRVTARVSFSVGHRCSLVRSPMPRALSPAPTPSSALHLPLVWIPVLLALSSCLGRRSFKSVDVAHGSSPNCVHIFPASVVVFKPRRACPCSQIQGRSSCMLASAVWPCSCPSHRR